MKSNFSRLPARRGYTLLEMLLVLAILLVIAGMVVPKLTGRREAANVDATKISIQGLEQALELYALDHDGKAPTTAEGLNVLMEATNNDANWRGPYLKKAPKDAWNQDFQYRCPPVKNKQKEFDLASAGADGVHGTTDDITNWD